MLNTEWNSNGRLEKHQIINPQCLNYDHVNLMFWISLADSVSLFR